jgi:hypothetical protein
VLVAVDSVKYTGADQDVGQALGYLAQRGTPGVGQLFMPLFQKQGQLSGWQRQQRRGALQRR